MLFKNISVLDENMQVIEDCYVATRDRKIAYVGKEMPEDDFGREYQGKGRLLMSGFFNAHAHSPMTLLRGYGENLALQEWLTTRIFPFEDKLDDNAVYWGTLLAMAESLQYGIISTSDMYYFCDVMAKAVIDSGAKENISRSISNFTGKPIKGQQNWNEMVWLYENCHNAADGRIKIDMSLHSEYTADEPTAVALAEYAKDIKDTILHIHVSETKSEHEECIERHGKTPAEFMNDAGLFDVPAIVAHCVYSTESDLEIFRSKGVTVATNPVSNMKLASGICDAYKVLQSGVNLAIGTDSVASNNNLNFFEEMKVLAIGSKIAAGSAVALSPEQILRAATLGGAKAQGRNGGLVKEGMDADLIVIDTTGVNMTPVHSIVNNLVYSCTGAEIRLTMVDGKVLYENGEFTTIDIERTKFEVAKATQGILEKL